MNNPDPSMSQIVNEKKESDLRRNVIILMVIAGCCSYLVNPENFNFLQSSHSSATAIGWFFGWLIGFYGSIYLVALVLTFIIRLFKSNVRTEKTFAYVLGVFIFLEIITIFGNRLEHRAVNADYKSANYHNTSPLPANPQPRDMRMLYKAEVDGNTIVGISDKSGITIVNNDDEYHISREQLEVAKKPLVEKIQRRLLNMPAMSSADMELVMQAFGVYGFLLGSESKYTDWCSPYYKLTERPVKFKEHFKNTRAKAEKIITNALGLDARESLQDVAEEIARANDLRQQIVDKEYMDAKLEIEREGGSLSVRDFCEVIDKGANLDLIELDKMFQQVYPGF